MSLLSPADSSLLRVGQTDVRVGAGSGLVTTKHRNLEMSEIEKNLPEKLTSCLLIRLLAVLANTLSSRSKLRSQTLLRSFSSEPNKIGPKHMAELDLGGSSPRQD